MKRLWVPFNRGQYRKCMCCGVLFGDDSAVIVTEDSEGDLASCVYCEGVGAVRNAAAREWRIDVDFTATRIDDAQGDLFGP